MLHTTPAVSICLAYLTKCVYNIVIIPEGNENYAKIIMLLISQNVLFTVIMGLFTTLRITLIEMQI